MVDKIKPNAHHPGRFGWERIEVMTITQRIRYRRWMRKVNQFTTERKLNDLPRPNTQNPSHPETNRIKPKRNGRQTAHDQTAVHQNGTTGNYIIRTAFDGDS
jgi:hypothetical protein